MNQLKRTLSLSLFILTLGGCNLQNSTEQAVQDQTQSDPFSVEKKPTKETGQGSDSVGTTVIYGDDNRRDLYEEFKSDLVEVAQSTVALVQSHSLRQIGSLSYQLQTRSYGTSQRLCKDEPFYEQGVAAFCSGSLVAKDLVLTAGHCIDELSCPNINFLFDFSKTRRERETFIYQEDQIYSCAEVVVSQYLNGAPDFAVIRLDREVEDRLPLRFRRSGEVQRGTPLTLIGHPSGLPLKIAGGAEVRRVERENIIANTDSYGGNSGSAVLNSETLEIEGILVYGEQDFVQRGSCRVSAVCPDSGCRGERLTKVSQALPYLPSEEPSDSGEPDDDVDEENNSDDDFPWWWFWF